MGVTHFANNIRTCERSQSPRYPIFWMSMFWMSWLSLSRWHVTQSWSSIHSILTSLQEAAPRPQQTSLQPHNLEKHAQSSVLAGLATRGLLTHNAHSGSNTDVSLPIPYPSHPTILSRICLPYQKGRTASPSPRPSHPTILSRIRLPYSKGLTASPSPHPSHPTVLSRIRFPY